MLPSTPQATARATLISPLAARYPAGGMTSSLGKGRIDDSTAMSAMMPGYPMPRNRFKSQPMNDSSIEAVFSDQRDESRAGPGCVPRSAGAPSPAPLDQCEDLGTPLPQRDQDPAVRGQLLDEWRRDARSGRPREGRR